MRRTLEVKNKPAGLRQQATGNPPQTSIPCGPVRDCIRLRGLPFEVQVYHLLDFLGSYAKHIVFQGVHMVYNHMVSFVFLIVFPSCHRDSKKKKIIISTCHYFVGATHLKGMWCVFVYVG